MTGMYLNRIWGFLTLSLITVFVLTGCFDGSAKPEELNQDLLALRLTEIHYNPLGLDDYSSDSLEFIEIKNTGSTSLDLGKLEFSDGIKYSFPPGSQIASNSFYVIASSKNAFKKRYGFEPDDVYSGQLKNSGETIELTDAASMEVIFSQTYYDSGSWPGSADGKGYSLVSVNPNPGRNETASNLWRPSTNLHGSPGADDLLKAADSLLFDLRITEINYHPAHPDTAIEDSLEFIELKNAGDNILNLGSVGIDDAIEYKFAEGATLAPGGFIVLASSAQWFKQAYGFEPFGTYKGQLKNSGETIKVIDHKAAIELISISYSDKSPWPKDPDGTGRTLVPLHANPSREEQNSPAAWRASFTVNGSPGKDDPEAVLINEVLTHTDPPQVDAIELYNPNNSDIDLGGWYLSDDIKNPIKYRIADGTIIKAEGYKVFTETDFNADSTPASFGLSENGEDVVLSADTTGCFGYCFSFSFGALERGTSFGRHIVPSTGNDVFVPLARVTLGAANSEPLVGPLVISEIMCQSSGGTADFLEITNISNQEAPLYDPKYPDNTWRIQIDTMFFYFPSDKSVKAGESIVITCGTTSIDAFKSTYAVSAEVQVFSFTTSLPDTAAKVELEKPLEPNEDSTGTPISQKIKYMEYDKISYKNQAPWPVGATSDQSTSLTRSNTTKFGNDPANWELKKATPGTVQ